jgi:hypothetical protein
LPEIGPANTAAKVLRWLRFIDNMVSLFATMSRILVYMKKGINGSDTHSQCNGILRGQVARQAN